MKNAVLHCSYSAPVRVSVGWVVMSFVARALMFCFLRPVVGVRDAERDTDVVDVRVATDCVCFLGVNITVFFVVRVDVF